MEGNFFGQRRVELKVTQREIADACDVEPQTVSGWERGISMPAAKIQPSAAIAYKVSEERLSREIRNIIKEQQAMAAK